MGKKNISNYNACPSCSALKAKHASVCRRCYVPARKFGSLNPAWKGGSKNECPACGGLKSKNADTCWGCFKQNQRGSNHPQWKGGRNQTEDGYITVPAPTGYDGLGAKNGRVLEHRLVMEEHLGRRLTKDETVHHKNGIRDHNQIENLELWTSRHPRGQRVEDLLKWAKEFISFYEVAPAHQNYPPGWKAAVLDFDGTLAENLWTHENPTTDIGEPIWVNIVKAKELAYNGYKLTIHTARGWEDSEAIQEWLEKYGIPYRTVVCSKPLGLVYVDDRAKHSDAESWMP